MKSKRKPPAPAAKGRPRSFALDRALDRAMRVFWSKGYEGTSLSELTRVMRIDRPSLYAAFGDKAALFRKALEHYAGGPGGYLERALREPTARAVVEKVLHGAADLQTDPSNPGGCLLVRSALAGGPETAPIRQEVLLRRAAAEAALRRRLQRARAAGDLPPTADPADLARFVLTIMQGMAVHAASGANRRQLQRVIALAMRAWPA